MQKNFLKRWLIFSITAALIGSCIDKNYVLSDLPDPTINPKDGFELPLGSLRKSVKDVLRDVGIDDRQELIVMERDTIYIMYKDTLSFSSPNDDMFPCPDKTVTLPFVDDRLKNLEFPIPIPTGTWSSRIDSIRLVNTTINIRVINSTLSGSADFSLKLPTGLEPANPADTTFTIAPGTNPVNHPIRIKDSSILKLQEENGGYMFYAAVELKTNETLTPLNYVTIEFSFTSLDAHTVWGNFDNIVLEPVNGNKYMGVFESLNDSSALLFANPSFKCEVHNYIGIGATLTVENIQTYIAGNSSSYVAAYFNNEKPTYPIVLPPAPKPDNESSGKTTVLFDKNNGQIDQLFFRDPPPNHIDYNFSIIPSTGDGFFVKGGKKYIDVIVDARLPLSFNSGTRFYSVDTLELDLTTDIDLSAGQKFALFLDYENRFCVGLDLDVQFMDENKNPIPSLAQKNTMEAADTWTNIANAKPKTGSIQFVFEGNQLNDMKKVKYVAFKSDAKTAGFGNPNSTETVNIHPDDYIKFTISAFGKFEIK